MNTDLYKDTYRQEAEDLIADTEATLLDIEKNPEDMELLNRMFRNMHTIKGSGAMFGFENISSFAHHLETALEKVCKGIVPVTEDFIDLILASLDQIKSMLAEDNEALVDYKVISRIVAALEAMMPEEDDLTDNETEETIHPQISTEGQDKTYHIKFYPDPAIFTSGIDPLLLLDELRELGICMVETHTEKIPVIHDMNYEKCYLSWDFILTTSQGIDAIKEVFLFVEDSSKINIQEISEPAEKDISEKSEKTLLSLCERLLDIGYITADEFKNVMESPDQISSLLVDAGVVSREGVKSGIDAGEKEKTVSADSIRVSLNRIDQLVNLVGELTITQQRLNQIASDINETKLRNTLKTAKRLTGELRDCILGIRMIPIGSTFSSYRRYVRDISNELGKEIELVTEGADTELDKTIIEHLGNPLVHLIRNSIDHGIETPDKREKAGKPAKGKIVLSAAHQGSSVGITIEDDGCGIDSEFVRAKAVDKGLIDPDAVLSEKEIYNLIFAPGFSTSKAVTSISGRGVGMDIVKRAIDSLRGSIRITSRKGEGTTISLSLPLTLAIIEGLMVKAGESFFILPIDIVEGCIELTKDLIEKARGRNMIWVREELVSFIRLREIFAVSGNNPSTEQIVITKTEDSHTGIVVDEVIGEHQTVVKSLGKFYQKEEWISGATIMGDGAVVLILDVQGLINCANQEREAR
ncbi:MAG: chemotaxis protein CheA [Desulfobacteraceae bacterium]|nr:chemotaxis protein CheA [Desulfobacteraceae bacterium]